MTISKESKSLGMSWEKEYGYSQAVKVDNTIYVSGQVSHDDKGNIVGRGDMQVQMRQAYANIFCKLSGIGSGNLDGSRAIGSAIFFPVVTSNLAPCIGHVITFPFRVPIESGALL
jgi:enamine deaminase RidA (YjgF/YER057c/UK114 family)